jgi:hypothetical protein
MQFFIWLSSGFHNYSLHATRSLIASRSHST